MPPPFPPLTPYRPNIPNEKPGFTKAPRNYASSFQTVPVPTPEPNMSPGRTPMPVGNQQKQTYYAIPPVKVLNKLYPSTIIGQFKKAWNKKNNYIKKVYDILENKFRFFLNICYTSGIRQTQFYTVFLTILLSRAALYFFHNVPCY